MESGAGVTEYGVVPEFGGGRGMDNKVFRPKTPPYGHGQEELQGTTHGPRSNENDF